MLFSCQAGRGTPDGRKNSVQWAVTVTQPLFPRQTPVSLQVVSETFPAFKEKRVNDYGVRSRAGEKKRSGSAEQDEDALADDYSLVRYNRALLGYQTQHARGAHGAASTAGEEPLAVLEDLYHHLEPLEDFLAVKICLLLLEARAAKERRSGLRRNQQFCARSVVTVFFSISCLQEQQIPQNAFTNTVNIVSTPATKNALPSASLWRWT